VRRSEAIVAAFASTASAAEPLSDPSFATNRPTLGVHAASRSCSTPLFVASNHALSNVRAPHNEVRLGEPQLYHRAISGGPGVSEKGGIDCDLRWAWRRQAVRYKILIPPCGGSNPSLSGRVGVKQSGGDATRRGPRFSSGSALWPSHDGIRRMRRTNLWTRPCRKTYGRNKDSKRPHEVHFLGFRFQYRQTAEGCETAVLLSAEAERRLRNIVRELTPQREAHSPRA
jgi:hypothetical protein